MAAILMAASCIVTYGQGVESFVTAMLEQYPQSRLLDIYKSCFQDYMGAEHLVADTASVKHYLDQELAMVNAEDLQPWYYEPCGINGNYVRVSLRAVIDGHISADALCEAFIASANTEVRPSVDSWSAQWHDIVATIDQMGLNLAHYDDDRQFIENVLAQGAYAISHSPDYRNAYGPHYRIVERSIFERQLLPLLPCCCHR